MILEKCKKKYRQAVNTYAEHYSNRERKSHMTFKRLSERFIVMVLWRKSLKNPKLMWL